MAAFSVPNDPATNPQPDVDLTVGRNQVVGDAPPSDGTGVSVSVTPTTKLAREAVRAVKHRLGVEGSRLHRADRADPAAVPAAAPHHFHTASARAAAFPGLQPEIESFGGGGFPPAPSGGP